MVLRVWWSSLTRIVPKVSSIWRNWSYRDLSEWKFMLLKSDPRQFFLPKFQQRWMTMKRLATILSFLWIFTFSFDDVFGFSSCVINSSVFNHLFWLFELATALFSFAIVLELLIHTDIVSLPVTGRCSLFASHINFPTDKLVADI